MIGASGRQRAKRAVIEDITLRVPLLPVQREIASVLSPYDDLIANNRRRIQLLEESAQLLYKEWFVYLRFPGHEHVKIVDGVPKGWIKTTIADLCDSVNYGYTASATAEPVGPKFLRITDIVPDVINWSSVPFCSIPENKKEQFLLKEGDVVVARTGATTGYAKRIGKTHPKTVFASYLIRLRLKSEIDDMLVGIFVESDDYKSYIKAQVGGAAQPNANAKIISSAKILIPPNNIQRYFHEMIEPIFECKDNLQAQNEKLTQARDLLLPRLMNGEIAV
jgi:type I restriction enzyme S subunit